MDEHMQHQRVQLQSNIFHPAMPLETGSTLQLSGQGIMNQTNAPEFSFPVYIVDDWSWVFDFTNAVM